MNSLVRLAFRNAIRNGRRSVLTAGTVAIGTAMVVVTLSFLHGMMGGMTQTYVELNGHVRVVTSAYAEREQLAPLHENIDPSAPLLTKIAAIDGVKAAAPMIRTGVIISVGEEIGEDGTQLVGSSQEWFETYLLPNSTLAGGTWLDPASKEEQVVVGSRIARDVGVSVGDEVLLMGTTQHGSMAPISAEVVGILTGNGTVDVQSYVTLETARWMTDIPEGVLEIDVYADDGSDAGVAALSTAIEASLGDNYSVGPWYHQGIWKQTKPLVDSISLVFSVIIVFVMALAVFNTMTMSVLERTAEIGVMRAMGQSRAGAVASFLLESLLIGLVGGIVGISAGSIPAIYLATQGYSFDAAVLEDMGSEYPISSTLYAEYSVDIVLIALFVGLATAALGAFFPSLRAARIPPYEAMRAQR